jgi:hypothetical protein|nr:MAG TPA: hypothetical protein [Caudoviricetes sp.]
MLEKIIQFFNEHPIRFFVRIFLGLIVVPTAFIHIIYVVPTESWWSQETISAGSMLSYIGTVLTFCATFMLSITVYLSNKKQAERMQLIENKAVFLIDNNKNVEVDLLNLKKEKLDDIFIELRWKVLSDAVISKIVMKCLTIEDLEHPREREKQFFIKYEKGKNIIFKYREDKNNIDITLNLKDEKAQEILRKDPWIGISGDFDVYCENVKTSVTMNISCWSYRKNEDIVAHMSYEIRNSNFFSHKSKLC